MDDRRFDTLTRLFGGGASRRALLKGVLGIGGVTATGSLALDTTDAARRPAPPPKPQSCPGRQMPCGDGCCCPPGLSNCGSDCCPPEAQCCDGACCLGTCYGEELCCPYPNQYCSVDGCCSGVCVENGHSCCPSEAVCGDACCGDTERCCAADPNAPVCRPAGACCFDSDCVDGTCDEGNCIPISPPLDPSFAITFSSVGSGFCSPIVSMSGLAPNTTYRYQLDLRSVSTSQTGTLFLFDKATDGSGNTTANNRADITNELYEVQASMDTYASDWVLVSC